MQLPQHDLIMRRRNPNTTQDLIIPIILTCNTTDDDLINNIKANSILPREWLKLHDEHEGEAVMCGSGPSLSDNLDEIKSRQLNGGVIFAMNGSAKFLADNGIYPDYQVMVDARQQTADLVGPAKAHLIASQCHPDVFALLPECIMWHQEIGNILDILPDREEFALIGGAAAVGNSAICIAYTLGFRNIQIYGYDSSHREAKGHAFDQPMNAEDPITVVKFRGKDYLCSYTMKSQAHKFQQTAKALEDMGCTISVHGDGLLPDIWNSPKCNEREKYEKMWGIDQYRSVSPGELVVDKFLQVVSPSKGDKIADFGCGTGRGGLTISKSIECDMILIDFTENSRDKAAREIPFVLADLTQPIPVLVKHGYCCDVMEHIRPEDVDAVIQNIMDSCSGCFFQISTVPDIMGAEIGEQLHLTVENCQWWAAKFVQLGFSVKWQEEGEIASMFYVVKA